MLKLKRALSILVLCISTAWAGPYIELGVGTTLGPNTIENVARPQVENHVNAHDTAGDGVGHEQGDIFLEDSVGRPDKPVYQTNNNQGQTDVTCIFLENDFRELPQGGEVGRDGEE